MKYISTRGGVPAIPFTDVLMAGLAADGGLYVPEAFPALTGVKKNMAYIDTAQAVLASLTDLDPGTLRKLLEDTYRVRPDGFQVPEVTPLKRLDDGLSVLELFHGPTIAFKDVALQLLGRLFDHQLRTSGDTITIVGATSGDTGSAAIEGCRHASGAKIVILYPDGRTSEVQRRQMTTVDAPNVHTLAVQGTFDDCQAMLKALFNDAEFRRTHALSAVNSINWARIAAQIVYYIQAAYSYDEPVTFVVPTGNFGNVYAAYVAKKMGAPIRRLVVASNRNDILTRFFENGTMKKRTVEPSLSPSMDIQVSSNFERLLFELCDRDAGMLKTMLGSFQEAGSFSVTRPMLENAGDLFSAARCNDEETLSAITTAHRDYGYLMDPHTAVAFHAWQTLKNELEGPVVIMGCAHPAKFPDAVEKATGIRPHLPVSLTDLYERPERYTVVPNDINAIRTFIASH
jgi:threonine synthase